MEVVPCLTYPPGSGHKDVMRGYTGLDGGPGYDVRIYSILYAVVSRRGWDVKTAKNTVN